MFIARVCGNVVITQKVPKMAGKKLLVVEPLRVDEKNQTVGPTGRSLVAIDQLGAGLEDVVLVAQGSSARMTDFTSDVPCDCVIVGIIDAVTAVGKTVYQKSK